MLAIIQLISKYIIPLLLSLILLYALYKKVAIYESFIEGAKEGIPTILSILPHLVGMMAAVNIFKQTGSLQFYLDLLRPVASFFNIPSEVLPLAFLRPISGTASLAYVEGILTSYGPDSFLGRLASTIQGSMDTTLYIFTVYFGAVGVKKSLYALKVGLIADIAGFIASLVICTIMFS